MTDFNSPGEISRSAVMLSDARFRAAMDAVAGVLWVANSDGNFVEEQPSWLALTGQTLDGMQDGGWLETVHPDDRIRTLTTWLCAIKSKTPYEIEHRVRCNDGSFRHFRCRAVPVRDDQDKIIEWVGVHTDISDAKQAATLLADSEHRHRSLIERCSTMMWVNDANGRCTMLNKAFRQFTGRTIEDFDFGSLCHARSVSTRLKSRENIRLGQSYDATLLLRTESGEYRWCETSVSPVCDSMGFVESWVGCAIDVHDRVLAQETIETELALNKILLDELNHRVRNTLTIVQSMVKQTLKNSISLPEFAQTFEGRLFGLSATHDILVEGAWHGASLKALLFAELEPVCTDSRDRWIVFGDDIRLSANQAVSIGMLAHELATNAVKYGSLSGVSGKLDITINVEDARAKLRWVESSGPVVVAPAKTGFGTRLLRKIESQLRGELTIAYEPSGLVVEFSMPLSVFDMHAGGN